MHWFEGMGVVVAGQLEEVAAAVAFLASQDASSITGTTFDVDGGSNA